MELIVIMCGLIAAAVAVQIKPHLRRAEFERLLTRWIDKLDLHLHEGSTSTARLFGTVDGRQVTVEMGKGGRVVTIIIDTEFPPSVFIELSPASEAGIRANDDLTKYADVWDGTAVAFVDRSLLGAAKGARFLGIDNARLRIRWEDMTPDDHTDVIRRVRRVTAWARHAMNQVYDVPERLAHHAMHNPDVATREVTMRALRLHHADTDLTRNARRAGLDDPHPLVRIESATCLGPDGLRVLRRIVEDENLESTHRTRALNQLISESAPELHRKVLLGVAFAKDPHVAAVALRQLQRCADDATTDRILTWARGRRLAPLAMAALVAYLGVAGRQEGIELLVWAIDNYDDDYVRRSATNAVRSLGPNAILRTIAALSPHHQHKEIVAELREGLDGGRSGALAITKGDGGDLAIAEAPEINDDG